ncbi:hypothetical protein [Sorangium sp. So ce1389]
MAIRGVRRRHDPALDLDLATGRVTVRDEEKRGAWTVSVQRDPAAAAGQ